MTGNSCISILTDLLSTPTRVLALKSTGQKRQTGSLAGWVKMVVGWRRRVVGNLAEEDGFMECVVQGNVFGVTRGTSHRFLSPRRPRNGPRSKGVTVATDGFARIRAISIVRVGIANVLHRVRSSELERGACLLGTGPPGLRLPSVQGGSNQEKRRGDQQRMRCQPHPFPGPHLRHEKRLRGLACLFKTTFDLYNPTLLRGKRQTPANPENHQRARRTPLPRRTVQRDPAQYMYSIHTISRLSRSLT